MLHGKLLVHALYSHFQLAVFTIPIYTALVLGNIKKVKTIIMHKTIMMRI